jgi:osmoprotectant transport system substrate-binding protein
MRKIQLGAAVLALGLALTACSSDADTSDTASDAESNETLVVAAYNFSESEIIANLYAGALNAAGSTAEIQTLTNREVVIPAVTENELQVVGEYVGTLTEFLNKDINGPDAPAQASSDLDETMTNLRALAEQRDLEVLEPAPAQDQNAFAVTKEFAEKNNLKTLSDLGEYSKGDPVVLGGPPECPQRPFCQPGLEETYGLEVAEFLSLDAGGPLTKQSLEQGKIDVGLVLSSDGSLNSLDLVVLEDDKKLQTVDNVVPVLNKEAVTEQITEVLNKVSAALTTEDLQELNESVDLNRENPADVADAWLATNGLG